MAMMKKLTSALVASSLVLGLVGTAGATTPDKIQAAANRMAALGLVKGKGGPDLALDDNLTRAELVTIIDRAFGQESNSKLLNGVAAFPDTADHWASGYIAMATKLIAERTNGTEVVGMPDGTFQPDAPVTAGEAVAFLMKFIGAPKDNNLAWPDNYLQGALNAGIITAEDLATLQGIKNEPATRGLAFYLADNAFYGYKLAEGSTVYRTFVDTVAPELNITTQVAGPTLDKKITVTGTVANAEKVFIGTPDKEVPVVNGSFSVDVDLALGENNITVTAVDLVGNITERSLQVTRTTGPAVGISAEDITVAAGETVDLNAAVVDEVGNPLEGYTITGESEVGTVADGKFTAGTKAGEGKLVLKAGENGEFTKEVKVTVVPAALAAVKAANPFAPGSAVQLVGVDAYGNAIEGVTFAEAEDSPNAYIEGDRLIVTKEGSYKVSGTLGDVTVTSTVTAYGETANLQVEADKKSIVANNESTVTVTVKAIDENGNFVPDFNGYVRYEGELTVDNDDVVDVKGDFAIAEVKDGVATFVFKAEDTNLVDEDVDLEFFLYEDYDSASDARSKDRVADAELTIEVEEQKATSVKLDAPEYLPVNLNGYKTKVEVILLDQDGYEMLESDEYDLEVEVDGPALIGIDEDGDGDIDDEDDEAEFEDVELGKDADDYKIYLVPNDDEDTGKVTLNVKVKKVGDAKVTLKAVESKTAKAIKLTGDDEADVSIDGTKYAEYTVQLVDRNGVPAENDKGYEVSVKLDGVDFVGGVLVKDAGWERVMGESFTVKPDPETGEATFYLASQYADVISVSAEAKNDDDKLNESETVETTFKAGKPAYIAFKNADLYFLTEATAENTIVAQLYDEFGNPVKKSGVEATLTVGEKDEKFDGRVEINGERIDKGGDELTVRTNKDGQIVLNVETARAVDLLTLTIEPDDSDLVPDKLLAPLPDTITLHSRRHVAKSVDIAVHDKDGKVTRVKPGQSYNLVITVKDDDRDPFEGNEGDGIAARIIYSAEIGAGHKVFVEDLTQYKVDNKPGVYTVPVQLGNISKWESHNESGTMANVGKVTITVEILDGEEIISDSVRVNVDK